MPARPPPGLFHLKCSTALIARAYTPDFAVGVGGQNLRKDVLLVQFFLAAAPRKPWLDEGIARDLTVGAWRG